MKVVSLMAGTSSRLKPLTDHCHKVLLEVGGKTLLEHQLDAFEKVGIDEAVFVVGHRADVIKSKVGNTHNSVDVTYVLNRDYSTKNVNYSLYKAQEHVEESSFVYLEADLLFHPDILKRILESERKDCLCIDENPKSHMVDTLVLGRSGTVEGLLFEEHGDLKDAISTQNVVGEFLPMVKFSRESGDLLFAELRKDPFTGTCTLYNIFSRLFGMREAGYVYTEDLPWVEIDTFSDLETARKDIYPQFKTLESISR